MNKTFLTSIISFHDTSYSLRSCLYHLHLQIRKVTALLPGYSLILCQGTSETRNVSHPSAHRTPTDLQNRHSRGRVPAECLEQKMLYAYATVCTQGAENEKKAVFSFCPSPTIYNKWVTWRVGAKQVRCGYPLSSMKMHQANAAYGEKDK